MSSSWIHDCRRLRQIFSIALMMLLIDAPVFGVLLDAVHAGATGEYTNAKIADTALGYVGQWGGNACVDAQKPGDSSGQCRSFVNCVVWMASNHVQNLGGADYFRPFRREGGKRITSISDLRKGDIVQDGEGAHTFIIVKHVRGHVFSVVDSNHVYRERVRQYNRPVSLSSWTRAYRMGAILKKPAKPKTPADLGYLSQVRAVPGGAVVRGWGVRPDSAKTASVTVYGGSGQPSEINPSVKLKANVANAKEAKEYPGYGKKHDFEGFIVLPSGTQQICAYVDGAPSASAQLDCQVITVPQS
jgi:hypothetical protein